MLRVLLLWLDTVPAHAGAAFDRGGYCLMLCEPGPWLTLQHTPRVTGLPARVPALGMVDTLRDYYRSFARLNTHTRRCVDGGPHLDGYSVHPKCAAM